MVEGLPLGIIAPSTIAGLAVLLVLTGRLVPRRTYDDKSHEATEWRTESRIKDQQIAEQNQQIVAKDRQIAEKDMQLRSLDTVGRTVNAVMRAIQHGAGQDEVSE